MMVVLWLVAMFLLRFIGYMVDVSVLQLCGVM